MMNDDKTLNLSFINSFEIAWQSGQIPSLADNLPDPSSEGYLGTLQELVIIDLEFRWKRYSAESPDVAQSPEPIEAYIGRFAVLGEATILWRLVEEEFVIRHRYGDRADPSHFVARFPQHAELIEKLCIDYPADAPRHATASSVPIPGEPVIENYSLIKEIGEGGMGSVYLAQQEYPVRRKVAVKVIRSGLDSKEVIARFEAERQALAMMDHQNIARVFDAGSTQQEQPFFAMEYVEGIPITDNCQAKRTSIPDRLKLFNDVCAAVQHAHQKGILHRDLKPSNVLIAEEDINLSLQTFNSAMQILEPTDPVVSQSARRLTRSYSQAVSAGTTFEIDQGAVEFITKQLPGDNPDALLAMFDLAETYSNRGKRQQAIGLHSKVLALRRQHLGNQHHDTLYSVGYLGMLYNQANDAEKSLPLCLEMYRATPSVFWQASQEASGACIGLQTAYRMVGDPEKAIKVGNETLAAFRKELDETHPLVMGIKYWVAVCQCEVGQFDPAIAMLREVVRDRKEILGETAIATIDALNVLANAYQGKDDFDPAIKTIESLVEAQKKAFGERDERVRDSIGSLAFLNELAGHYEKAAKYNALYAASVTFSTDTNDLWSYQIAVARECHCLIQSNRLEEAEIKLAMLAARSFLLPPSYLHFQFKSLRGEIKSRRKEFATAEPMLLEGYEGLKKYRASIPENWISSGETFRGRIQNDAFGG